MSSGGCSSVCSCGRFHFDFHNRYDWEDGQLERYQKASEKEPDKYIGHDYSVECADLFGRHTVLGCPCGFDRKVENFLIENGQRIADYLNARSKMLADESKAIFVAGRLSHDTFEEVKKFYQESTL